MSNFNLVTKSHIENAIGGETKLIDELRKRFGFKSDNDLTLLKSFGANLWVTALKYKYRLLPDLYQASGIMKTPMSESSHNADFSSSWLNPILNKEGYYLRFNVV